MRAFALARFPPPASNPPTHLELQVKIYAWYDNECGYSMRTAELARLVAKKWLAA